MPKAALLWQYGLQVQWDEDRYLACMVVRVCVHACIRKVVYAAYAANMYMHACGLGVIIVLIALLLTC